MAIADWVAQQNCAGYWGEVATGLMMLPGMMVGAALSGGYDDPGGAPGDVPGAVGAVQSGLSPDRAAFQTFTGKTAARLGFTNVEILKDIPGKVEVVFTK
jgi:hypothetical protein